MSARNTPVAWMGQHRYQDWYDRRCRKLRRERWIRYAVAAVALVLPCLVAFVVVGYVVGAL